MLLFDPSPSALKLAVVKRQNLSKQIKDNPKILTQHLVEAYGSLRLDTSFSPTQIFEIMQDETSN